MSKLKNAAIDIENDVELDIEELFIPPIPSRVWMKEMLQTVVETLQRLCESTNRSQNEETHKRRQIWQCYIFTEMESQRIMTRGSSGSG